uniref:UBC core domain-containing protein n=1 Tax=Xiphophorus couchianus TaxID=32473 RepID=A0A3B5KSL6_9TELE
MLRCCQLSPPVSACSCMCSHILICTNCDISLWLQDNLFEWHFSVRGPPDSDFDGGVYHGRIVLPPEYPMKPPKDHFLHLNIYLFKMKSWRCLH